MEQTEESYALTDGAPPAPALSPTDLLGLAQGFSRILWSIPLGLFLFTGAMDFAVSLYFRLPSYIVAVLLFLWGLLRLRRVHSMSRQWTHYLHVAFLLVILLIYFSPFVYWWTHFPEGDHFVINLFGMLLAATWLLWSINRLAGEVASALQDRFFLIECRLSGWAVQALMSAPVFLYFVYATLYAGRADIPLHRTLEDLRYLPYIQWYFALVLLPLTLTIAIAWKTKERAFTLLRVQAEMKP